MTLFHRCSAAAARIELQLGCAPSIPTRTERSAQRGWKNVIGIWTPPRRTWSRNSVNALVWYPITLSNGGRALEDTEDSNRAARRSSPRQQELVRVQRQG